MTEKAAIIVIDMLKDFVTGALKCERARRIIPNIRRLLERGRGKGIPVIYASDAHVPEVDHEFKLWGSHAVEGTNGAQVIDELKPQEGDHVIGKRRYSAFFGTDLDLLLKELDVSTVILTGLHSNLCVKHTAADAFFRGYSVVIPEDCVEAFTEEDFRFGIEYMRKMYGAKIISSKDLF